MRRDRGDRGRSVPWLLWDGGTEIWCSRCGDRHTIPAGERLTIVGEFVELLMHFHRRCPPRPEDTYLGYW
jgi:hypothetical protein